MIISAIVYACSRHGDGLGGKKPSNTELQHTSGQASSCISMLERMFVGAVKKRVRLPSRPGRPERSSIQATNKASNGKTTTAAAGWAETGNVPASLIVRFGLDHTHRSIRGPLFVPGQVEWPRKQSVWVCGSLHGLRELAVETAVDFEVLAMINRGGE